MLSANEICTSIWEVGQSEIRWDVVHADLYLCYVRSARSNRMCNVRGFSQRQTRTEKRYRLLSVQRQARLCASYDVLGSDTHRHSHSPTLHVFVSFCHARLESHMFYNVNSSDVVVCLVDRFSYFACLLR